MHVFGMVAVLVVILGLIVILGGVAYIVAWSVRRGWEAGKPHQ